MEEDDIDEEKRKADRLLRPACIALMAAKDSSSRIREMERILAALETIHHPEVVLDKGRVLYTIYPFSILLKYQLTPDQDDMQLDKVLECVHALIDKSWYQYMTSEDFLQILSVDIIVLGGSPGRKDNPSSKASEISKAMACKTISLMLRKVKLPSESILDGKRLKGIFQHLIIVLLHVIRAEHLLALRLDALDCLHGMFLIINDADVLAGILPGIISNMVNVLQERERRENNQILVKALEVMGQVLIPTLQDSVNEDIVTIVFSLDDLVSKLNTKKDNNDSAIRTISWLKATKSQILNAFKSILPLRNHDHPAVRQALARICGEFLLKCSTTLDNCVALLTELLVILCADDYGSVSNEASSYICFIKSSNMSKQFLSSLQASLHDWLLSFPRIFFGANEKHKQDLTAQITVAVEVLGERTKSVVSLALETIVYDWLNALSLMMLGFSVTSNGLLEDEKFREIQTPSFPCFPFKYAGSTKIVQSVSKMIRTIGSQSDTHMLVTYFLRFAGRRQNRGFEFQQASALWVVKELMKCKSDDIDKIAKEVFNAGLEILANDDIDEEETPTDKGDPAFAENAGTLVTLLSEKPRRVSTKDLVEQANIRICLALEVIAISSQIIGRSFRLNLMDCLYHVLVHLGRANSVIQDTALTSLRHIANHCEYPSMEIMLLDNVDYVVNAVSQRLAFAELHPQAPGVMRAMVRVVGEPIVPLLEDSIQEVFDALDKYHGYDALVDALFAVLTDVMRVIPFEDTNIRGAIPRRPEFDIAMAQGLIKDMEVGISKEMRIFVDWFRRRKNKQDELSFIPHPRTASMKEINDDVDGNDMQDQAQGLQKEEPSLTGGQMLAISILQKSAYFITHASPLLRARILELIQLGIPILARCQSDLLPLINKIWPFILNRLGDKELYVVMQAAGVVAMASQHCGDFMTQRIISDAWPKFRELLHKQAIEDSKSAIALKSQFSMSTKLAQSIIITMTRIIVSVPIEERLLWDIGKSFLSYIGRDALEKYTSDLYSAVSKVNADIAWLLLSAVKGGGRIEAPHTDFRSIDIPSFGNVKDIGKLETIL